MLPPRIIPPGVNPLQSPGGAYFYVDNKDRAVVSIGRQIFVVALSRRQTLRARPDLRPRARVIPDDDQLNSALPDWSGRLWFVCRRHGIVGALDPAQRQRAPHAPHERGDRQLVRDGRDRRRVRRHRQGAVPLRHHPPGQAQGQLARALQQRRHREAGPVRRRLRHHADADGQAVPVDRGQRRPHEGGGPAARGAPEARASAGSCASSPSSRRGGAPRRTRSSPPAAR